MPDELEYHSQIPNFVIKLIKSLKIENEIYLN